MIRIFFYARNREQKFALQRSDEFQKENIGIVTNNKI